MGARHVSGALSAILGLLAALAPAPAAAQNAPPASPAQARHRAAVRTERTGRFFAACSAAPDAVRAAAGDLLRATLEGRAPPGTRPELLALAQAERVLGGADPAAVRADALAMFADGLDLQVAPGAFSAHGEGLGEPVTVTVYRLERDPPAPDCELSLDWIAPDGVRTRARTEPFGAQAFRGAGFKMYVRAPRSPPGLWHLQPVVRAGGREVEGVPVPVECVAQLAPRAARARAAALGAGGGAETALDRLDALLALGLRAPELAGASAWLAALEEPAAAPAWSAPGGGEPFLFGGFEGAEKRGALAFLWSEDDAEELPLAGPVGEAWRALARERGLGLFVLRVRAGEGPRLRAGLEELERLAGRAPVLVARGRGAFVASLLLPGAAAGGEVLPLSGLVLLYPAAGLPRLLPPVPTLVVGPPGGEAPPPGLRFVPGGVFPFLDEPRLPALVGEWLAP